MGGFDVEWVAISGELKDADEWTPKSIGERADRLVRRALEVWPAPLMEEAVCESYLPEKKGASGARPITFKDIFSAGAIRAGDVRYEGAEPRNMRPFDPRLVDIVTQPMNVSNLIDRMKHDEIVCLSF
ncbi:MAG: hypothetical protein IKG21_10310 [Atopobiaceae bacterium]|nr:hypothetical protein [Atopobiaceae bacterium]